MGTLVQMRSKLKTFIFFIHVDTGSNRVAQIQMLDS